MAIAHDQTRQERSGLHEQLAERERQVADKERQLERYAADLRETFKQERRRAQELEASYVATVRALTNAVEARDAYTGKHAERVAAYGLAIGAELEGDGLPDDPGVEFGFLLHDVGKVAIPDSILHKPGPLTDAERTLMERHPLLGEEILGAVHVRFLDEAKRIVRSHHERWDGGGYPDGLKGEEIPLTARVFSVADALDALTTDRPYRAATPPAEARLIIEAESGRQFDPRAVAAFMRVPDAALERIRAAVG